MRLTAKQKLWIPIWVAFIAAVAGLSTNTPGWWTVGQLYRNATLAGDILVGGAIYLLIIAAPTVLNAHLMLKHFSTGLYRERPVFVVLHALVTLMTMVLFVAAPVVLWLVRG